ncbi:hypothetical protein [Niallia sp. FSL M8-0099]|uniref:hypothetical protein n=1 Tax=Niallia sp. FSL M8-0099 TaxID=2954519 RepID=UPI0030F5DF96
MKQFRTVKRRAKVGERILITNKSEWEHRYKNGNVGEVLGLGVESVFVQFEGVNAGVADCEYEVIIEEVNPKEENEMNIEKRFELAVNNVREAVEELRLAALAKGYEDARRDLTAVTPPFKTPQQQRDEIIEQAKRDVAELESIMDSSFRPPINGNNTFMEMRTFVKFFVNKEKRAVTALVYCCEYGYLVEKGIAKCAPTDCFNVHIGKAIALRRALGLDVPSEYLNVPQPTEVRVGDVIIYKDPIMESATDTVVSVESKKGVVRYYMKSGGFEWRDEIEIIDDSREKE